MNKFLPKQIVLLVSLSFWSVLTTAQNFHWKAQLADSVTADGFYNIALPPAINAKLSNNFSDIRIVDNENYQVPYLYKVEDAYFSEEKFKEYPIVSKEIIKNCCTKIVLKNPGKKPINNICVVLQNSDAIKVARIAGSNDGVNWYGVKRFEVFYNNYSETDTKIINYINFPLTDYLYYTLEIIDRGYWDEERWAYWYADRWSYPINILKIGYYETIVREGKYTNVPSPDFTQNDSIEAKKSYIKINFDDTHFIDRIQFQCKGPRFYKRNAVLAKKIKGTKKAPDYFEPVASFVLNSYSLNEFTTQLPREKELYLIIDNDDNRPLQVTAIHVWQRTQYLKTYLEKGKKYQLVYDDSTASIPVYDLQFFVDSIPAILPSLPISSIEESKVSTDQLKTRKTKEPLWFENKLFIWIAIGLVMLLLLFMSYKMLKEMKKN